MMIPHLLAFLCGAVLDLVIGDPHSIPHPVQWIGKLISFLETFFFARAERSGTAGTSVSADSGICADEKTDYSAYAEHPKRETDTVRRAKRRYGRYMAGLVVAAAAIISFLILAAGYAIYPAAGFILETVMTCQILAGRSLQKESMKVYDRLQNGTLSEARKAVSMIVGRDTELLDTEQIIKAAVETVAENTSDGVIAPMLYTALGGPVLGWAYKAINTMDSMVGYRNERYIDFGRGPAHLDDIVNYIPSRISAVLMIAAAGILEVFSLRRPPVYDAKHAAEVWKRDRRKHASPNSAQTESVMAGALCVQLAGDAYYFGRLVRKPYIGDQIRPIEPEDIRRANRLMLMTAFLCEACCVGIMTAFL